MTIYTIGHSNQPLDSFLRLLKEHKIEVVVDVRSIPVSKYATHFNQKEFAPALSKAGVKYVYMGTELGGRPQTSDYYDSKHRVLYDQVARTPAFREGISRLMDGMTRYQITIMCSEEDPSNCHRRLLIGQLLANMGIEVAHIRGNGAIQTEADLSRLERAASEQEPQLALFESTSEYKAWRSAKPIPSALRKDEPKTSSKR